MWLEAAMAWVWEKKREEENEKKEERKEKGKWKKGATINVGEMRWKGIRFFFIVWMVEMKPKVNDPNSIPHMGMENLA